MNTLQPDSSSFVPEFNAMLSRRQFFRKNAMGLGVAASFIAARPARLRFAGGGGC